MSSYHISVVILNYNSEKDSQALADQLSRQVGVRLTTILVDNASKPESLNAVKTWIAGWQPVAVCGSLNKVLLWVRHNNAQRKAPGQVYLIENNENQGYSTGNNAGIRLADELGVDAVLIANPDMRIDDPNFLAELSRHLFADQNNKVAASRIVGLDGQEQNPLREASFWEELFWPRFFLRWVFRPNAYVLPCPPDRPTVVPKVSGCCLMLRMDFLRATNYLDENVFLYCEEPILSARVKAAGGRITYVPTVSATHAHVKSEKGDGTKRMLQFIVSRKYYLKTYSGYNRLQLGLLDLSYAMLALYNRVIGAIRTIQAKRSVDRGTSHV